MSNPIVTTAVTQLVAPAPSTLQRTGAFISQGATTLAAGVPALLTQASDLTPLLQPTQAPLHSLSWSGGVATATCANTTIASGTYTAGAVSLTLTADIGLVAGMIVTIAGATGTGAYGDINGTYICGPGTTGGTVNYTIATGLTMTITGGSVYAGHGVAMSSTFLTTIAGATPSNYNGTFLATATNGYQFTYALASDGGTTPATGTITFTPYNQAALVANVATFFAQGNGVPVYVLELGGATTPAQGVTTLAAYMASPYVQANGKALPFYAYYQPRLWDVETTAPTLAKANANLTSKVYFFQKTTLSTYTPWLGVKSVVTGVTAANAPATEESLVAMFWRILSYNPSVTNKLSPTAFAYQYDVTPFGPSSTQAATLKANFINYIDTGAEGGLSNTILKYGKTMDGNDFTYWYAVDWMQINYDLFLAAAVIQGANTQPPLVYNQQGINSLQSVAQGVTNNGVAYGVINNATPVAAIPFTTYVAEEPSDYQNGIYNGLSEIAVPQTGFTSITFNLTVSSLGVA